MGIKEPPWDFDRDRVSEREAQIIDGIASAHSIGMIAALRLAAPKEADLAALQEQLLDTAVDIMRTRFPDLNFRRH